MLNVLVEAAGAEEPTTAVGLQICCSPNVVLEADRTLRAVLTRKSEPRDLLHLQIAQVRLAVWHEAVLLHIIGDALQDVSGG